MNNIVKQLNDIVLEAEIVGMQKQENKFKYADTDDLDNLITQFLWSLDIKSIKVQNGFIHLC